MMSVLACLESSSLDFCIEAELGVQWRLTPQYDRSSAASWLTLYPRRHLPLGLVLLCALHPRGVSYRIPRMWGSEVGVGEELPCGEERGGEVLSVYWRCGL